MTRQSVTDEQYGQFCRRLDDLKRRLLQGTLPFEPTMKAVQDIIEGKRRTFKVLVDYAKTLKEMIEEGKYDRADSYIVHENFPLQGKGRQEVEIQPFHFGCAVKSKEVLEEMEKQGFRPATLPELLALGAADRELQKEFPIVALGSRWRNPNGDLDVPILDWYGLKRALNLNWFGHDWNELCRFAGVRK